MKSGFRIAVSLALCLLLLSPASPASACCENGDFWCWAGVVASGGISCAVENLINSIQDLIRDVNTLANTISAEINKVKQASVGGVQSAGDDLKKLSKQARDDADEAARRARAIKEAEDARAARVVMTGRDGSIPKVRTVPVPAPDAADEKKIMASLNRAADSYAQILASTSMAGGGASADADNARKQASDASEANGKIAKDNLVTPLTDLSKMLGDLVAHPDRLFNPVALVDDQVRRITAKIDSELGKVADSTARSAKGSLDASAEKTRAAGDAANAAKAIADQMEKLQKSRTKADLERLDAMLPAPSSPLAPHFVAPAFVGGLAARRLLASNALLKTGAGKSKGTEVAGALNSNLVRGWDAIQKKQLAVLRPMPVPGADAKFQQKFEEMFRGLTKSQADAKKNELLAEARRRFGNDAKTLAQTQNLINLQAQKSLPGGVLPLISR